MSQVTFRYKAIDRRGARTRGVLQAATPEEAYRRIKAAGLRPLRLKAGRPAHSGWRSTSVGPRDLAQLTCQLAVLVEAGIPIADGLRSIAEQEHNRRLQRVILEVAGQIEAGHSVTEALAQHERLFGGVYIETVRAAEAAGNMVKVLARLAEVLERQHDNARAIRGAMIYPACVLVAMLLGVSFLLVSIIPRFTALYEGRGLDLPLPTQILIGASHVVRHWWFLCLAGASAALLAARAASRRPAVRARIDTWLHKVPFLRDVLRAVAVSRFAHLLGITLQSGIGLLEALEMAGSASGRPLLQSDAERLCDHVRQGGRLADVMLACTYLPGFARRMIAAGEEAAQLPRMCEIVARHYDREVAHLARNLPSVLEPVLIVLLAGGFLLIALAVFMPMWQVGELVR